MFSSSIKNIESGEIVFVFPVIKGTAKDRMKLIERLKQRILGYWVTKNLADYERRPPNYEAYKAFLEGIKIWDQKPYNAGLVFEKAMLLDSNFHLAKILRARNFKKLYQFEKADSMRTELEQNKSQLNSIELTELKNLEVSLTANKNLEWRLMNSEGRPFFMSQIYWEYEKINTLMNHFNQNEKAVEYLQNVDLSSLDYKLADNGYFYFLNTIAYFKTGKFEKATELAMNPPFEMSFHENWARLIHWQLAMLAKMGAYEGLDERLEHYYHTQPASVPYAKHDQRFFAIRSMFSADPKTAALYAGKYLQFLKEEYKDPSKMRIGLTLEEIICELHLALHEPEKIKLLIQKGTGLNDSNKNVLTLKGIYYAQQKNENDARKMIQALKEMDSKYNFGVIEYCSAIIEAWLGNKQLACSLLEDSIKKGRFISFDRFSGDWRLQPLFNYPYFKNKVLAPIPLPELEIPSADKPKTKQSYWTYIVGLMISGLGLYLFFRNRQQKSSNLSKSPIQESQTSQIETEDEFFNKV